MSRRSEVYITGVRQAANQLINAHNQLLAYRREADGGNYGLNLQDGSPGGANDGILAADVLAVVYATADAIKTVLDAGNETNIVKIL